MKWLASILISLLVGSAAAQETYNRYQQEAIAYGLVLDEQWKNGQITEAQRNYLMTQKVNQLRSQIEADNRALETDNRAKQREIDANVRAIEAEQRAIQADARAREAARDAAVLNALGAAAAASQASRPYTLSPPTPPPVNCTTYRSGPYGTINCR